MNQLSIISTPHDSTVTMTSTEIVDFINAHAKKHKRCHKVLQGSNRQRNAIRQEHHQPKQSA